MTLEGINQIYFIGIKGVGMAALAVLSKEKGFQTAGSDEAADFGTDASLKKANIKIYDNFNKNNLDNFIQNSAKALVIVTAAHGGLANIEAKYARQRKIKVVTYGEALGLFMQGKEGISVAGSHGKTTIAAIISHLLVSANLDPSYIVGCSKIKSLEKAGQSGCGSYFVAEADEYVSDPLFDLTPKLLYQNPKIAVISNIDFDHPDVYASKNEVLSVFIKFIKKIKKRGTLIFYGDEDYTGKIKKSSGAATYTYGFSPGSDFQIKKISVQNGKTSFWAEFLGKKIGKFTLSIFGKQNVLNASAAVLTSYKAGLSWKAIKKTITSFSGTKRRFEYVGKNKKGAIIYDDYAHHPRQIEATYEAAKAFFPEKRIIAVFQPHTYSRTKAFLEQFAKSLSCFEIVIILNIFPSAREKKDKSVTGKTIVDRARLYNRNVFFAKSLKSAAEILEQKAGGNDIILTLGAGDISKIHSLLL